MKKTHDRHSASTNEIDPDLGASEAGSREKLMDVALKLFAEKGFEGVSTRDLAGAAGVNISLISYYFGGKEGLYRAAVGGFAETAERQLTSLLSIYKEEILSRETYMSMMRELVRNIVEFKSSKPYISELMMREMIEGFPYLREMYETLFKSMTEQVVGRMLAAQRKQILRADVNVYVIFFSMIHSIDCYFMARRRHAPLSEQCQVSNEQIIDNMVKIFIEGVLA